MRTTHQKKVNLTMKKLNGFVICAAVAVFAGSVSPVLAQSQSSAERGIAASPKVRQMLNERPALAPRSVSATGGAEIADLACCQASCCAPQKSIAASPKLQQFLSERKASNCNTYNTGGQVAVASANACVKCCN